MPLLKEGNAGNEWLGAFSAGRFAGRTGRSSSSSLAVRSITCAADLLFVEGRAAEGAEDGSLDWIGVCCKDNVVEIGSCLTGVNPDSLISIKSSSSGVGWGAPLAPVVSSLLGVAHVPSGSMTTCSTSVDVEWRISSTYLHCQLCNIELMEDNLLVNLQRLKTSRFGTHGTCPGRCLFLQLQKRGSIEALVMRAHH